ncbi:MAG: NAD(P)-binding domain-containing protein [Candidatus Tectimicrobiota bacterium]
MESRRAREQARRTLVPGAPRRAVFRTVQGEQGVHHQADHETIILGAGPAGLQLGYFLATRGRDYLILEAGESPGSFFTRFPRHGKLLSINKVYTGSDDPAVNLRWDWNSLLCTDGIPFKAYSTEYFPRTDVLVQYLRDFASHFHLQIQCNTRIQRITREGDFLLQDAQGQSYRCQRLVVATGVSQPYIPAIPGIEQAELYTDVSIDPQDFVNQRVLILGKGNSAFETAENLVGTAALIHLASPQPITMAWQSHYAGHLRAVNNNVLDTYQLKAQNALLNAQVERITHAQGRYQVTVTYSHAAAEQECLYYDRVIVCTGFRFDATIFDATCRPELTINDRLPAQTSAWESTNVSDLYFAGTLMQARDYKHASSPFIHGFRYNVRALFHILEVRYQQQPWPGTWLACDPAGLTDYVIARVNRTSALWQQFGFLADVIVLDDAKRQAWCYAAMPLAYIHETACRQQPHYYTITLEYGAQRVSDPFNINRPHSQDSANAHHSQFLHPVIRRFDRGRLVSEHHIMEDLEAVWNDDCHVTPLRHYFERALDVPGYEQAA